MSDFFTKLFVGDAAQAVIDRAKAIKGERPSATKIIVTPEELAALVDYASRLMDFERLSGEKYSSARGLVIHDMTVCTCDEPEGVDLFNHLFT